MAIHASNNTPGGADREIVLSRLLDAPRTLVFDTWTDPAHVAAWWGPDGFTTTVHEMHVRPGGVWRFVMHGPDGTDFPNWIKYDDVVPPERLVFQHGAGPDDPNMFHVTVTFEAVGDRTLLSMRMVFTTAAQRNLTFGFNAVALGYQTLAKFEEEVARRRAAQGASLVDRELVIVRTFDAPRDLMFKVWTDPEHLAQWWGPKGFAMDVLSVDLRPGGMFHYAMRPPNGEQMWGRFTYREIVPPKRLVFVNAFSDASGGIGPNPWLPVWPLELLNTLTFLEHEGKTTLVLRGLPINASEAERRAFLDMRTNMQQGFKGTFEQLQEHLRSVVVR